jgi:hypothetical protein
MSKRRIRQPSFRPRTVYSCIEEERNWAWRPKRAAMQLQQQRRRKTEQEKHR